MSDNDDDDEYETPAATIINAILVKVDGTSSRIDVGTDWSAFARAIGAQYINDLSGCALQELGLPLDRYIAVWGDEEGILNNKPIHKLCPELRGDLLVTMSTSDGRSVSLPENVHVRSLVK